MTGSGHVCSKSAVFLFLRYPAPCTVKQKVLYCCLCMQVCNMYSPYVIP